MGSRGSCLSWGLWASWLTSLIGNTLHPQVAVCFHVVDGLRVEVVGELEVHLAAWWSGHNGWKWSIHSWHSPAGRESQIPQSSGLCYACCCPQWHWWPPGHWKGLMCKLRLLLSLSRLSTKLLALEVTWPQTLRHSLGLGFRSLVTRLTSHD